MVMATGLRKKRKDLFFPVNINNIRNPIPVLRGPWISVNNSVSFVTYGQKRKWWCIFRLFFLFPYEYLLIHMSYSFPFHSLFFVVSYQCCGAGARAARNHVILVEPESELLYRRTAMQPYLKMSLTWTVYHLYH
jgi:hypothetical protein